MSPFIIWIFWYTLFIILYRNQCAFNVNNVDPDQTPAASPLGLHCLSVSILECYHDVRIFGFSINDLIPSYFRYISVAFGYLI